MNFIVLDLEWNQCADGKKKEKTLLPFEVIEIGAVKVDANLRVIDHFHEIIRPQVYKTLHFHTKEVISLREKDFEGKRLFPEVIQDFKEWCGENPKFCTWGTLDLLELQRNVSWYQISNFFDFPLFYYDIQKIFSIVYEDRKTRRSLEYAAEYFSIEKNLPFHNAYSDACYTQKIMEHLTIDDIVQNSSIDTYRTPSNRKEEIYVEYSTYSKFISKEFLSKDTLLKDRVVTATRCPLCKRTVYKKIRWFPAGSHNYLCLCQCPQHGFVKGKLRVRQHRKGAFYAVRTIKNICEEDAFSIRQKRELIRQKKKKKEK